MRVRHPCLPALRLVMIACVAFAISLFAASAQVAEPPPEPEYPKREGMTESAWNAAWQAWHEAHSAWESNLTAGQVLLLERRPREGHASGPSPFWLANNLPQVDGDYAWRKTAERWKLSPESLASLESHQVAFGDSVRQSFSPYLRGPVFITSDSALNAFHILFEDSFRELELRRCATLRRDLEAIIGDARKLAAGGGGRDKEPLMTMGRHARGMAHLERVLGPALVVVGAPIESFSESVRGDIQRESERIRSASSTELPAWLAPAEPETLEDIDFRRCRPVGFYAGSTRLGAFFRAIRWLQMVPFRAAREHEFDAVVLFGIAAKERHLDDALRSIEVFVGRGDDPTSFDLIDVLDHTFPRPAPNFDSQRTEVRTEVSRDFIRNGYYQINSDLRQGRSMQETFEALTFRLVPAAAFPDSVVFQELMDRGAAPGGLVVAGLLGSDFSLRLLDAPTRELIQNGTLRLAESTEGLRRGEAASLYAAYLGTLQALFLPVENGAPRFMQTEFWQAKNCQTALAGWAQMRHTYTLQAKMAENYRGLSFSPPGFVEESPEFFARLARLVDRSSASFAEAKCFDSSAAEEAERIEGLIAQLQQISTDNAQEFVGPFTSDILEYISFGSQLHAFPKAKDAPGLLELKGPAFEARKSELIRGLEANAAALDAGTVQPESQHSVLQDRWSKLSRIIHTLEALAHKGLRAEPWSPEEEQFLRNYGEEMAFVMGYFGNSWLTPRDDAPRWAEVCGFTDRGTSLVAAVGRPREIFVLHPWKGMEVLCRGSVMQYYEYESATRLTDEAWRGLLDSPEAPPLPAWLSGLASPPTFDPNKEH